MGRQKDETPFAVDWRRLVLGCLLCMPGGIWPDAEAAAPQEYELEGTIDQTILKSDGTPQTVINGKFKVFVRDEKWFIETLEHKQFAKSQQYLKREIGSTNGTEIFEIVTSLAPPGQQTNAIPMPATKGRPNTATVVAGAVPVGQLDGSIIGHLWLMFASGNYLSGLQTNLLTPVYDVTASAPGDPNLKYKANWELLDGPGSFPSKVTYFYDSRIFGDNEITNATYVMTGITNLGGTMFPTGFLFENYVGGVEARVRKRAAAVVSAIRPSCSLKILLPVAEDKTVVVDRRLAQAAESVKAITYSMQPKSSLPTVAEAKARSESKKTPPKRSSAVLAVILSTACIPPLIWLLFAWRRSKQRSARL